MASRSARTCACQEGCETCVPRMLTSSSLMVAFSSDHWWAGLAVDGFVLEFSGGADVRGGLGWKRGCVVVYVRMAGGRARRSW